MHEKKSQYCNGLLPLKYIDIPTKLIPITPDEYSVLRHKTHGSHFNGRITTTVKETITTIVSGLKVEIYTVDNGRYDGFAIKKRTRFHQIEQTSELSNSRRDQITNLLTITLTQTSK